MKKLIFFVGLSIVAVMYSDLSGQSVGFSQSGLSGLVSKPVNLKGKISNNRYFAPKNLFSVPCSNQTSISDYFKDKELAMLVLDTPFQKTVKIEYFLLEDDSLKDFFAEKGSFEKTMDIMFSDALDCLAGDKGFDPKTSILEKKYLSNQNQGHLFWGLIKFSDNVHRGLLYKAVGKDFVLVTVQFPAVIVSILEKAGSTITPAKILQEEALKTLDSMTFGS